MINYLAQKNKKICEKISHIFGAQSISIMVDYKNYNNKNYTYLESGKKISMLLKNFFVSIKNLNFGELILNSISNDGTGSGLDLKCVDCIPSSFNKPILLMGGAGKPEHITKVLKNKKVSGIITANLFNFLGSGLMDVRDFSLKNKIKLVKFNKIEEND